MITSVDSKAISHIKFLLLFGVIFVHMNPRTQELGNCNFSILSVAGITNSISIGVSYVWAFAAVPTYFLLSGYLFWREGGSWNWNLYGKKIKSRAKTLLLPYVIWNILSVLSFVIAMAVEGKHTQDIIGYLQEIGPSGLWDYCIWGRHKTNWLGWAIPNSGPFVISLWFLRDLIVAILFSPVIFWFLKKTKIWGIVILFICYWSKIWPQIHGFGIDAFFFFAIGLYLSMNKISIADVAKRIKRYSLTGAALFTFPCIYFNGVTTHIGRQIFPLFAICAVWSYIYGGIRLTEKNKLRIPSTFIAGSFFVYALHACPIANIGSLLAFVNTKLAPFFYRFAGGSLIYFLLAPFFTAAICYLAYYPIQKWMPTLSLCLTGHRRPTPPKHEVH